MPFIWLAAGLILAAYIFVREGNKFRASFLLISAVLLWASYLISNWLMTSFKMAPHTYLIMLLLHCLTLLQFAYLRLSYLHKIKTEQGKKAADEQLRQQKLKDQQKAADQEKLVTILQRERELLAELKEREGERAEAMRHAKNIADEANRAKSAFLAVISHEIRTPMTGIMGMIRLMLESNLDTEQKEYAQTIQYSGDALLALLNDILDFSKIEEGRMEIENVNFDVRRMIDSVVMLMSGRAKERNIELTAQVSDDLPEYLKGDPTRLRQVLLNLIGNAIKFTEKGGVKLIMNCEPGENQNMNVYFGVQDTGIGISEAAQKNLFTPFSQADSSISRRFGGTGLGLAICKRLIEAMGGDIHIDSTEGQGSLFYFIIPMKIGTKVVENRQAEAVDQPKNLNILVADDNEINQKVLIGLLKKDHHNVTAVNNGQEALDIIQSQKFDLVLMDMEMPVMNGLEATKAIRELDSKAGQTPIISMTANVIKEDIQRCLDAGMNDYVSKPIDPDKLRTAISKLSDYFQGSSAVIEEPDDEAGKAKSFNPDVVVQDDADDRELFDKDMIGNLRDSLGPSVLNEMMDDLYEKSEELIDAIERAYADKKYDDLRARAHDLKGMTANFGLFGLSEPAGTIEDGARDKRRFQEMERPVTSLQANYNTMRVQLDRWFKSLDK